MIRGVGVVGTGVVFAEHAAALGHAAPTDYGSSGVAEVDEHRRRAATDACFVPYATNDHRELVERPDVDVVVVCTPPSAHEAVVVDALAAGKHVVCEKPLAPDLATIDRIVDARANGAGPAVDGLPVAVPTGGAPHRPPPSTTGGSDGWCSVASNASPACRPATTSPGGGVVGTAPAAAR